MAVSHDPNTPPMVPSFDNILEYFTSLARFPSEEVETRFWRIADFDHKDPQEAHTKQEKCCANMSYHGPFDSQEAGRALVPVTPPSSSGHSPEADHHASTGVKLSEKVGKRHMKGHSKSRRGCFDCKRRKIKCQETRPQCLNCSRLGLKCRYGPEIIVPSPATSTTLHEHRAFSLTDMRLYHHFLHAAYPHFPVRTENIWLAYILPIGHQCEYLMHAMLALAASHLEKLAPNGLTKIAQAHRLEAFKGLNNALTSPLISPEDGDAAIAACYALFMQSWYMDDGLQSSLVLTRSLDLTTKQVKEQNLGSIFASENKDTRFSSMKARLKDTPKFDVEFIDAAVYSIEALGGLLMYDYELGLWNGLVDAFRSYYGDAEEAYCKYLDIDTLIVNLPHDDLMQLLFTDNPTSQLLLAHIVALHLSMRPISCKERKQYTVSFYGIRMSTWIPNIFNSIASEWQQYLKWPRMVAHLHNNGQLEGFSLGKGKKKGIVYDINAMDHEGVVHINL